MKNNGTTQTLTRYDSRSLFRVGGQAVLEGVMMRVPGRIATAVRRSDGSIQVESEPYVSMTEKIRLLALPVLRGAVGLIEMLMIGIRSLNASAAIALQDLESPSTAGDNRDSGHGEADGTRQRTGAKLGTAVAVGVALLAGIALFFATPLVVATSFFSVEQEPLKFNLIAGAIRVGLLLAYLGAISLLKDVRRIFEYHGAEHKAVFAYERRGDLSVTAAQGNSRFHPRCGTSFLLVVVLASVILFALLDAALIRLFGGISLGLRLMTHIPLVPLVGGISYEIIRFSAAQSGTVLGRIVVAPGLWLQRITTREPDSSQLEVALAALRAALGKERMPLEAPEMKETEPVT